MSHRQCIYAGMLARRFVTRTNAHLSSGIVSLCLCSDTLSLGSGLGVYVYCIYNNTCTILLY